MFQISSVYSAIMRALGATDRIMEVTEDKSTDMDYHDVNAHAAVPLPSACKIEFKDVAFAYPSRPEHNVLRELNLTIPPDSVVGVVGPSGCGKSTLISLLARFYEPLQGSILLNDVPVPESQLEARRAQ